LLSPTACRRDPRAGQVSGLLPAVAVSASGRIL